MNATPRHINRTADRYRASPSSIPRATRANPDRGAPQATPAPRETSPRAESSSPAPESLQSGRGRGQFGIELAEEVKTHPDLVASDPGFVSGLVTATLRSAFEDEPRPFQIASILALLEGGHLFVRAATASGKTRILEANSLFFGGRSRPTVVLVPLDALARAHAASLTAAGYRVALYTGESLEDPQERTRVSTIISALQFDFLIASPEMLMHDRLLASCFSKDRWRLAIGCFAIDEAHIVMDWGLRVGRIKGESKYANRRDEAFRPAFGALHARVSAVSNAFVLLLSATLPDPDLSSIVNSLGLRLGDFSVVNGPIDRLNQRHIWVPMAGKASGVDVVSSYMRGRTDFEAIPQALFYSTTRPGTIDMYDAALSATSSPPSSMSSVNRPYHAATGTADKLSVEQRIASGDLGSASSTVAMGLGLDFPHVRTVCALGSHGTAGALQILGRAGRDGEPALCIWEDARAKGGEAVSPIVNSMMCRRLLIASWSVQGTVVSSDDPSLPAIEDDDTCSCNRCDPSGCQALLSNSHLLTNENFGEAIGAIGDAAVRSALGIEDSGVTKVRSGKKATKSGLGVEPEEGSELLERLEQPVRAYADDLAQKVRTSVRTDRIWSNLMRQDLLKVVMQASTLAELRTLLPEPRRGLYAALWPIIRTWRSELIRSRDTGEPMASKRLRSVSPANSEALTASGKHPLSTRPDQLPDASQAREGRAQKRRALQDISNL